MLIATNFMLWELAGQWIGSPAEFSGTVSPLYTGLGGGGTDDFAWLVEFNGLAYTWYAGSVYSLGRRAVGAGAGRAARRDARRLRRGRHALRLHHRSGDRLHDDLMLRRPALVHARAGQ